MSVAAKDVIVGGKYRVIGVPAFRDSRFFQPDIGSVGECDWVNAKNNNMSISFGENSTVLGLGFVESINNNIKINDTFLITIIQESPERILRLIRGIAKMTKHSSFVNFLERAELPKYCSEPIRVDPKMTRLSKIENFIGSDLNEPDRNGMIKITDKNGHIQYIACES